MCKKHVIIYLMVFYVMENLECFKVIAQFDVLESDCKDRCTAE